MTLFLFQRYNDPPAPSLEELKSRQKKAVPTLEELKNKPKANVPWTKKTNAQPVKKEILAEEKEVKEFESCRKTLKENVKSEAAEKDTKKIQTVKKKEPTPPVAKEEKEASPPVSKEKKEKAESGPAPKEENILEVEEEKHAEISKELGLSIGGRNLQPQIDRQINNPLRHKLMFERMIIMD